MKGILTFALLPTLALAQTATATPSEHSADITPPSAAGDPHTCGREWYPPSALASGDQGTVSLGFRVGADGNTKDFKVLTSSGNADLDQAAIGCAATWKYHPALQKGQSIEVDWKANVQWSIDAGKTDNIIVTGTKISQTPEETKTPLQQQKLEPQKPIGDHVCKNPAKPAALLGKTTLVKFLITADGGVEQIQVIKTSGNRTLDGYGVACVKAWRFTPRQGGSSDIYISLMFVSLPW